jgi:Ca-activated chloride channel family protein
LDTVGLVVYNTFYTEMSPPSREKTGVANILKAIQKPKPEAAYTELYASLTLAAGSFSRLRGRKVIVVLSDGENYPYHEYSNGLHPVFKDKLYTYTEPIETSQENGVSIYAIHFGLQKDRYLEEIAVQTGGTVFDAGNQQELQTVYRLIHEQVAGEYLLGYRATMDPAEKKYVQVDLVPGSAGAGGAGAGAAAARRFYFSSAVLGMPMNRLSILLLIPLVLAVSLLVFLLSLRLERKRGPATMEVLHTRVGSTSTRVMPITSAKTVIGGAQSADLTIVGNPAVKQNHATIVHDPRKGSYTIVGSGDLRVNNQPAQTRVLEAGDVIDIGGATIVFDDGEL